MLFLVFLFARALACLLVGGTGEGSKDLEILVLRHQLRVLRRKDQRPKFQPLDRVLLAATSRAIPPGPMDGVHGQPVHTLALAPRAGEEEVDLPPASGAGPASAQPRGAS